MMKRVIACIVLLLACMACPSAYCKEKSCLQELRGFFGDPVHIDAEEEEWPDSVEFPVLDGGVTIYHGSDVTFIICNNLNDDGSSDLWIINNGNALSLTAQAISNDDDTAYVFYNVQAGIAVNYPAHGMAVEGMVTVTDFDRFCQILLGAWRAWSRILRRKRQSIRRMTGERGATGTPRRWKRTLPWMFRPRRSTATGAWRRMIHPGAAGAPGPKHR